MNNNSPFALFWYIVATEDAVREFIPDYVVEGQPPYLVLMVGDKGAMVWPLEFVREIMEGYIAAHKKLIEFAAAYEMKGDILQ